MNVGESGGGGFSGGRNRYKPMAEINVTPFVDVMLVLLIVFMVTAPMLAPGILVDMPKTAAKPLPEDTKPLVITLNHEGAIFLADSEISMEQLVPRLKAISGENRDARIYVKGDRRLDYGRVMEVIGAINSAGFKKVALQSERK